MRCQDLRQALKPGFLDVSATAERLQTIAHLKNCRTCRRLAAAVDPTLLFNLMPSELVGSEEVEEIRHTVQAMRRVRELEAWWTRGTRLGAVAGAFAALLVAAVLLFPRPSPDADSERIPFAGAVGVGSGLVSVPSRAGATRQIELRFELASSANIDHLSGAPEMHPLAETVVRADIGETVDQHLGDDHRLRFDLSWDSGEEVLRLVKFRLSKTEDHDQPALVSAELRAARDKTMILGLPAGADSVEQLWLRVTYTNAAEKPQ